MGTRLVGVTLALIAAGGLATACSSSSKSSSSSQGAPATTAAPTSTTVKSGSSVQPNDLAMGDCYNLPAADNPDVSNLTAGQTTTTLPNLSNVTIEDCALPHDAEVIAKATSPSDTGSSVPFPGTDVVTAETQKLCTDAFQGYDGVPLASSSLTVYLLYPSADSWPNGDRTEICSITPKDNSKLTGSVKGSNK